MNSPNILLSLVAAAAMAFGFSTSQAQAQCPADLNADHSVTAQDLAVLLAAWGPATTPVAADINQDQSVDAQDLAMMLAAWGFCPPPAWATVLVALPDPAVVTNATLRNAIIATGLPWRVRDNASNIEMVLVPPGTFTMGCSASVQSACVSDESPIHQVTLTSAFYLGRYEVTQAQWLAEMGSNPSYFPGSANSPSRPVEMVTWNMIQPFCTQNSLRLPTEAEWEYAYRAGTTTAFHSMPGFPNGTNADTMLGNIAWYSSNSSNETHVVGGKSANALGLHDMAGNVWEWCQDWYGSYATGSVTNPTGPTTGTARLLRGGSWLGSSNFCRASQRNGSTPDYIYALNGFRVARNP